MRDQFSYINKTYGLAVRRGTPLRFQGEACRVLSARWGAHLRVMSLQTNRKFIIHPTWEVDYMDVAHMSLRKHIVDPATDSLRVMATGSADPVNKAFHRYVIEGYDASNNVDCCPGDSRSASVILFQNGPIKEHGINGITHEALLDILIHRIEGFQSSEYRCQENEVALHHLTSALEALQSRTKRRLLEGTEGTNARDTSSSQLI